MQEVQEILEQGTATALGNGPFEGFVPEALTTLYVLCRPEGDIDNIAYVVVSTLPEDDDYEAETSVFAANEDGSLDLDCYISFGGALLELPGDHRAADVIEAMGYDIVAG